MTLCPEAGDRASGEPSQVAAPMFRQRQIYGIVMLCTFHIKSFQDEETAWAAAGDQDA